MRILIIGTTCSGKTVLGKHISEALGMPFAELDAIFWQQNWQPLPRDVFASRVDEIIKEDSWIIDGDYGIVREKVWARATDIVWLNLPVFTTLRRLLGRTMKRIITREVLFNGNRETFQGQFIDKDSLIRNFFKAYRRDEGRYMTLLGEEPYRSRAVILKNQKEIDKYLKRIYGLNGKGNADG